MLISWYAAYFLLLFLNLLSIKFILYHLLNVYFPSILINYFPPYFIQIIIFLQDNN